MKPPVHQYALVTGASTGIGLSICKALATRGFGLLMIARNEEALTARATSIAAEYSVPVHTLAIDLSDREAVDNVHSWATGLNVPIAFLVNNAGFGLDGRFEKVSLEGFNSMLDLNVRTVIGLTYRFLPELRKVPKGYILNISSMSMYWPLPFKSVYSGTKSFIYQFTRSLAIELEDSSVSATVTCPGPVPTTEKLAASIKANGAGSRRIAMEADAVADLSVAAALKRKHTFLPGFWPHFARVAFSLIPRWYRNREYKRLLDV